MGSRSGGGASVAAQDAIKASIDRLKDNHFKISRSGYFGVEGSGKKVRLITSTDPDATAVEFWRILTKNQSVTPLDNKKGWRVDFPDQSTAVYRPITSTSGSPAVTLTIGTNGLGVAPFQRIHFTKGATK